MAIDPVYARQLEMQAHAARRGRWIGLAMSVVAVTVATWPAITTPIPYERTCPIGVVLALAFIGGGLSVAAWFSRPHWRSVTWSRPGDAMAHLSLATSLLLSVAAVVMLQQVSCSQDFACGSTTYEVTLDPATVTDLETTVVRVRTDGVAEAAEVVGPDRDEFEVRVVDGYSPVPSSDVGIRSRELRRAGDTVEGDRQVRVYVHGAGVENRLTVSTVPVTFHRVDRPRCGSDTWEGRGEIDLADLSP